MLVSWPMKNILNHILTQAEAQKSSLCCVFDLDSTLFDLTDRKQQIMLSFLSRSGKAHLYPQESELLKKIEIRRHEFGVSEALNRIGISREKFSDFYKDLIAHWEYFFFHNDYIQYDLTYPGAVEYVQKLSRLGTHIIYLTGRDEPRMMTGTLASLKAAGFPLDQKNVEMILKPHKDFEDHTFKLDYMKDLESKFKEIWLFENEPVNINIIEKHCLKTQFVFLDTNHSGREQIGSHHYAIKDFRHSTADEPSA